MRRLAAAVVSGLALACSAAASPAAAPAATDATVVGLGGIQVRFATYTLDDARRDGYAPDRFCLDAASFGLAPHLGAMGFHATNESLLRGPIAPDRPQALMFDAEGRLLGVEYEILADAAKEPPTLFGRTFSKLPSHPGVAHEHYALHFWLVPNPNGQFADFNPRVTCPQGSTGPGAAQTLPPSEHGEGH